MKISGRSDESSKKPHQTLKEEELWNQTVEAYENGDVEMLRTLTAISDAMSPETPETETENEAVVELSKGEK